MPVFALDDELIFPHPVFHEPDGLLAVGGDLSPERLLLAYRWGIFPWYHDGQPLLWWWTVPRLMLRPEEVQIAHSLQQTIRRQIYQVTIDQQFEEVIRRCGAIRRKGQDGTWITSQMIDAYIELFRRGIAHSVEVWDGPTLVGGLYGILYGKIFSGESMFAEKSNASKVAFVHLTGWLQQKEVEWIDCQQDTPHMRTLGGKLIGEKGYLELLRKNHLHVLHQRAD